MDSLFGPRELRPSRKGPASVRLKALAARTPRQATEFELRKELDQETIDKLREQGKHLARLFKLPYQAIDAERDGVNGHYGICYEDGFILIRLRHARTGRLLKESSLVDTLCHELAHLRHFDHSIRFRRLYARILGKARTLGYYRPGPESDSPPQQLTLFGSGCGCAARGENA